jgi:hypothetical protein
VVRRPSWLSALEGLLFLLPPLVGVGVVGVLRAYPDPLVGRAMVLVASVGGLCIRLGVPICLYFDAGSLQKEGSWRPNRALYVLGALLVSAPAVALVYLYRRHRRVSVEAREGRWWIVVGAALAGMLVVVPIAALSLAIDVPGPVTTLAALVGALALGVLAPAIYRDAVYVWNRRRSTRGWRPNPALYLALALVGVTLPLLAAVVAGYYLWRRRSAVGGRRSHRVADKRVAGAGAATKGDPELLTGAMAQFTEDDEGKTVVNADGEEVGIVTAVEHGTAHVDPDPGITDKIMSALGWSDQDEDTYPLQEESVEAITDDEVRLASSAGAGTDAGTAGAGAGTTGTGDDTGVTDDDSGLTDDDDDLIGDDDDSGLTDDDDDLIGDDDSGITDDDDDLIGDDDDTIGSDDSGITDDDDLIGDDDDTIGDDDSGLTDDDDDDLLGDDDDDRDTGL